MSQVIVPRALRLDVAFRLGHTVPHSNEATSCVIPRLCLPASDLCQEVIWDAFLTMAESNKHTPGNLLRAPVED